MRTVLAASALALCLIVPTFAGETPGAAKEPAWSMNATIIEACSCQMFCPCYFNTSPAGHEGHEGHGAEHFCRANNAFRVNRGTYGAVKLDGAKFWVSADLGGDWSGGQMDWAVVTFDKSLSQPQRDAIANIVGHLYPAKWNSLTNAEGEISWTAGKDEAHALLDGGKTAEVHLKRFQGMTNEPVVIKNLKYWGAPRNNGFILMPNVVEAYRTGDKAFEFKGTNGFMITFDIDSKSVGGGVAGGK